MGSTTTANAHQWKYDTRGRTSWGALRGPQSGDPHTKRLYTGQLLDESTGLYYYGARYYDVAVGRFIQPDTEVPDRGNPLGLNRYAYSANSPCTYVDSSGHCWGIASFIRGIPGYDVTCDNIDLAFRVSADPRAPLEYRVGAGYYLWLMWTNHIVAAGSAAILTYEGAEALAGPATAVGTAACADNNCTNEAEAAAEGLKTVVKAGQDPKILWLGRGTDYIRMAQELGGSYIQFENWTWQKNLDVIHWAISQGYVIRLATPLEELPRDWFPVYFDELLSSGAWLQDCER